MTVSSSWVGSDPDALESRWILARLSQTSAAVNDSLAEYRFDEAANTIYQFFWGDLCDWYLEIVKLRLNFEAAYEVPIPTSDTAEESVSETTAALTTLVSVFESALRLLSPFMPFLTEEIWHALYAGLPPAKSIALTRFPQARDFPVNASSVSGMIRIQNLITTVRARRKELGVPEKEHVGLFIVADAGSMVGSTKPEINDVYRENEDMILRLARISAIEHKPFSFLEANPDLGWIPAFGPEVAVLYERTIDIPAERERLSKDLAKYEKGLAAAERQLSNDTFMAKAPAHIVEGLRKQAAETRTLYDKTRASLDSLG